MLGAAKTKQQATPPERADELAEIELEDYEGKPHRLGDYWRDRPAVFVFLRHYG
jgi:hypothetical protein